MPRARFSATPLLLAASAALLFAPTAWGQISIASLSGAEHVEPIAIAQIFSDGSVGQWHPYIISDLKREIQASDLTFGSAETTKLRGPGPEFVPTDGIECGGFDPVCTQLCAQTRRILQSCAFTYSGMRISATSSINSRGERGNVSQVFLAWTNKRSAGQLDDFVPPRVIGDTVIEVLLYDAPFSSNCEPFEPNLVGGVLVNFGPLDGKCGSDTYYYSTLNLREFADVCMTIPGPAVQFGYEVAFWYDDQRSARAANNQAVLWGAKDRLEQGSTDALGYIDLDYDGAFTPPGECISLESGCPSSLAAAVDFWGGSEQGIINLWDNGTFVTQFIAGCNGGDISTLESPGVVLGFDASRAIARQADDFTVPTGQTWRLDNMQWYLYQPASPPNEPINAGFARLWDGPPGAGGQVIAGDLTTNRLVGSEFMDIYRVTSSNPADCSRAVKRITLDMSWAPDLSGGTYWVELTTQGSPNFTGPFAPPTVPRSLNTDNSRRFLVSNQTWAPNMDSGLPVDFPFELEGSIISGSGCDVSQYTLSVTGTCPGQVVVAWENAAPSSQQGLVFGMNLGNTIIPPGSACEGTSLGISGGIRLVRVVSTGANGSGTLTGNTSSGACGAYLQLIEANSCRTSNIAQLP